MPRTTTLECSGCPPLRALTFDVLGLIKVIESRSKQGGIPKVVERWGEPESSNCVLAASIDDCKSHPLLAVARRNGKVEILNPLNGDLHVTISSVSDAGQRSEDDPVVGLHLFSRKNLELESSPFTLLTCTTKGNASMRSFEDASLHAGSDCTGTSRMWSVCSSGNILCSKVDGTENYALFGGKGVEMNVWDLEKCDKIWTAKPPPKNSLGIFTPTWFTSATFLNKDDHRKFVAGTNSHQVRLYDISAQRRPVLSVDFRETPIKAVAEDLDGHTIYLGNGSGDLAAIDMRTGKTLGCFIGKCSGSIRSIARHPEHPVILSCGLDRYLRFWDIKTRQLLSAVFLKQHLVNALIDSNFTDEDVTYSAADASFAKAQNANETEDVNEEETEPVERKKASKEKKANKESKEKKRRKEKSKENGGGKQLKRKKSSKISESVDACDSD